jgi:hypothetical protein
MFALEHQIRTRFGCKADEDRFETSPAALSVVYIEQMRFVPIERNSIS